jgi:hypothetical protein
MNNVRGNLITCAVHELHAHPAYLRHHLAVPAGQLSAVADRGELAFEEPLVTTKSRTIIDGYDRWELAKYKCRPTLPCIEYDLTDDEALNRLLQTHQRSNGLNDFCRILLALRP